MRYAQIRSMDISNGEGIGVSLFVQGCHFHCINCFNSETWDFTGGKPWTDSTEEKFLQLIDRPYIKRISILGGEPLADENVETIYTLINKISAGYDFYSPLSFVLEPGETIKIPTGIRCGMNNDWVLMLFPRSGLGFKYRIRLENTVGIIDSDYFYSDNEGHIMVKITNEGVKTMKVAKGDGFCQGIFLPYGITEDDKTEGTRNGGFGSTDK